MCLFMAIFIKFWWIKSAFYQKAYNIYEDISNHYKNN